MPEGFEQVPTVVPVQPLEGCGLRASLWCRVAPDDGFRPCGGFGRCAVEEDAPATRRGRLLKVPSAA